MHRRTSIHILTVAIVLLAAAAGFAQEVRFEVTVDRNRARLGERLELGLVFHNTQNMPALELPHYDGFEVQYLGPSTQMTIANGKADTSITHVYSLLALKTGTYTVGPLQFDYDGNTYVSNTAVIEIIDSDTQVSGPAQDASGTSLEDKTLLVLDPGKTTVYLNEVVPVKVRLLVNELMLRDIAFPAISQDAFFINQYGQPKQYRQNIGGRVYEVVEFETSMFGLRPGEFSFGPASVSCNLLVRSSRSSRRSAGAFGSFFDTRVFEDFFGGYERYPLSLSSNKLSVTVLPLPEEGKPPGFGGAVGSFHFSAEAHPAEVNVGDPVTVTMRVIGSGNLNTVSAPRMVSEEGFKIYEPRVQSSAEGKSFEQVVIPLEAGITGIPAFSFSYFDPQRQSYETITQGPFPLTVRKPEKDERLTFVEPSGMERVSRKQEELGSDIIFIKSSAGDLSRRERLFYQTPLFIVIQAFPLALFIAGAVFVSRKQRLRSDIRYARGLQAPRKARQGIRKAQALLKEADTAAFHDALYSTLKEYLGDRFHLPSAGMTASVVDEALAQKGLPQEILETVRGLFEECDMARYAPSAVTPEGMADSLRRLEETIDYLQRSKV